MSGKIIALYQNAAEYERMKDLLCHMPEGDHIASCLINSGVTVETLFGHAC